MKPNCEEIIQLLIENIALLIYVNETDLQGNNETDSWKFSVANLCMENLANETIYLLWGNYNVDNRKFSVANLCMKNLINTNSPHIFHWTLIIFRLIKKY